MAKPASGGIGHNAPPPPVPLTSAEIDAWAELEMAYWLVRREEVLQSLLTMDSLHPTVENENELAVLGEARRMGEALLRVAEQRRAELKKPFLDGGRRLDLFFKDRTAAVEAVIASLRDKMTVFSRALAAERQKKADADAARLRAEAERKAAEAMEAMRTQEAARQIDALDAAARAEADLIAAEDKADAPVRDTARVRGEYGANITLREFIEVEISDVDAVPRSLMIPNLVEIRKRAREMWANEDFRAAIRSGEMFIPGVRIRVETESVVR